MGHKVPLLLESFPVPPTFVPPPSSSATILYFDQTSEGSSPISSPISTPSPTSASLNPPPSLPPQGPLPPVPGRSRISEHEAAFFLQSRRNSRYSINSSHSSGGRPDSIASIASARSNGASYAYGNGYSRLTAPEVQIDNTEDTSEAYDGLEVPVKLPSLRIPAVPPSPTYSEEITTPLSSQFPTPPPLSPFEMQQAHAIHRTSVSPLKLSAPSSPLSPPGSGPPSDRPASPNDSLAEISMHDLPSADDGAESEWDVPTTRPITTKAHAPSSFTTPTSRSESRTSLRRMSRISVDNVDSASLRASIATSPNPARLNSPPPSLSPRSSIPPPLTATSSLTFPSNADADTDDDSEIHRSLHRELRSARSRSRSHRERLGFSPIPSPSAATAEFSWPPMSHVPSSSSSSAEKPPGSEASMISVKYGNGGRTSPDIQTLLESTPRPRRSQSRTRRSSTGSKNSRRSSARGSVHRRKSDYGDVGLNGDEWDDFAVSARAMIGRGRKSSRRRLGNNHEVEEVGLRLQKLERELDGVGSDSGSDKVDERRSYGDGFGFGAQRESELLELGLDSDSSDSSLDLHTPLPNLMLRHGLLSPNSKLLPTMVSTSVDSLASAAPDANGITAANRPGSTMSMLSNASIQTRSGLLKDTRDTSTRRLRHKDGRLLRGGIGLTTGLGWSDSEDEGAPSALTRRLSTLNLSRNSSTASLPSQGERSKSYGSLRASTSLSSFSRPSTLASSIRSSTFSNGSRSYNPLSRSYSSRTLDTDIDEVEEVSEFGEVSSSKGKEKMPPTSWSGSRSVSHGRGGIKSSGSSSSTLSLNTTTLLSNYKSGDRTPKTSSQGKGSRIVRSSSEASIYSSVSEVAGNPSMSRLVYGADEYATLTPSSSTTSSLSIPLPVTPRDGYGDDDALVTPTPALAEEARFNTAPLNTNKMLPSLPNPKTGSIRRPSATISTNMTTPMKKSNLRQRSLSASSFKGALDVQHGIPAIPSSSLMTPRTVTSSASSSPQPPRQLHLPRHNPITNTNGQIPVPVPGLGLSASASGGSRLRLPSPSAPPSHAIPPTPLSPPTDHMNMKPKSRVGTGMAYRSSSLGNSSSTSGMRLPSSRTAPVIGAKF